MDSSVDAVIIGMGYVGLAARAEASAAGSASSVWTSIPKWSTGSTAVRSHVDDLADADVAEMLGRGFRATTDAASSPSPDDRDLRADAAVDRGGPDLGRLRAAAASVAEQLRPGMLVVLESTTYPGTTDEVVRPMLEAGGLTAGERLPPRLLARAHRPGQPDVRPANTPKVVGGYTPACADAAEAFYAVRRHGRAYQGHPRGRDGQAAGEHLPPHQHRPGQRDGAVLPRARHRPVGRDPLRLDQAVRLPGVLPRARASAGTASRSTRTTCPTTCGPSSATRSASSSWPQEINADDAGVRRAARAEPAQRRRQGDARLDGAAARRDLQARHRRPARVAGGPAGPAP